VTVDDLVSGISQGVDIYDQAFAPLSFSRATGGAQPLVDSGGLAASLQGGPDHVESVDADGFTVGTRYVGARLQQYGGVVTPVNARWLAIPKTAEARRAGSPRNMANLFAKFGPRGGVLVDRTTKVVHYALTKQTTHVPRAFVGAGERLLLKLEVETRTFAADPAGKGEG
jgi:hypothetical protein